MKATMTWTGALALFAALAQASDDFLDAKGATCGFYPTKVSKLRACATGTAFCESYLGATTATCTRHHHTTVTVPAAGTTTTVTTTSTTTGAPVSTDTVTAATVTISAAFTSTLTSLASSCAVAKRTVEAIEARAAPTPQGIAASCNLYRKAVPAKVTGACNIILASTTSITKTKTSGSAQTATITTTVTTSVAGAPVTVTTTPVSTVYTTTVVASTTACATACPGSGNFYLQAQGTGNPLVDGFFLTAPLSAGPGAFTIFPFLATPFSLDPTTHHLSAVGAFNGVATTQANNGNNPLIGFDAVIFNPIGFNLPFGGGYLTCGFVGGMLDCTVNSETAFSVAGIVLNIYKGSTPFLQNAISFYGFCAA